MEHPASSISLNSKRHFPPVFGDDDDTLDDTAINYHLKQDLFSNKNTALTSLLYPGFVRHSSSGLSSTLASRRPSYAAEVRHSNTVDYNQINLDDLNSYYHQGFPNWLSNSRRLTGDPSYHPSSGNTSGQSFPNRNGLSRSSLDFLDTFGTNSVDDDEDIPLDFPKLLLSQNSVNSKSKSFSFSQGETEQLSRQRSNLLSLARNIAKIVETNAPPSPPTDSKQQRAPELAVKELDSALRNINLDDIKSKANNLRSPSNAHLQRNWNDQPNWQYESRKIMQEVEQYFSAPTENFDQSFLKNLNNMQYSNASSLNGIIPQQSMQIYVVKFRAGRINFFYKPENARFDVNIRDFVITEGDRGFDCGQVIADKITSQTVQQIQDIQTQLRQSSLQNKAGQELSESEKAIPEAAKISLKQIFRLAEPHEVSLLVCKYHDEAHAIMVCNSKIFQRRLPMEAVESEYQWDRKKLIIYYKSASRVDFRELVRDLFKVFKTRIWLCAIGTRLTTSLFRDLENSFSNFHVSDNVDANATHEATDLTHMNRTHPSFLANGITSSQGRQFNTEQVVYY